MAKKATQGKITRSEEGQIKALHVRFGYLLCSADRWRSKFRGVFIPSFEIAKWERAAETMDLYLKTYPDADERDIAKNIVRLLDGKSVPGGRRSRVYKVYEQTCK
jgi:hypothetical protein